MDEKISVNEYIATAKSLCRIYDNMGTFSISLMIDDIITSFSLVTIACKYEWGQEAADRVAAIIDEFLDEHDEKAGELVEKIKKIKEEE